MRTPFQHGPGGVLSQHETQRNKPRRIAAMIARQAARMRKVFAPLFALALLPATPAAAQDTVRLRGDYVVTLLGLTVGRGGWDVRIGADHYIVTGNGRSAGLAALISSGHGEASADGLMRAGTPVPRRYDYHSTTTQKYDEIHFLLQDGAVNDLRIDPPQGRNRKRVALEARHKEGVVDPIGGVLMPSTAGIGPQSCARSLNVFDGRMRYDLKFTFLRMEQVKTDTGYAGPVAVCALRFTPIAGHVPDRPAIKYLTELTTMEAWLAPVAGTTLVVPWRVVIPTPFGTAVMQAERFQAVAK